MELRITLINLDKKDLELTTLMKDSVSTFDEKFGECFNTKAELNKRVAEENGITIKDLINSPNYKYLIDDLDIQLLLMLLML